MLHLHIGVGKTATTTLQEAFFPGLSGIVYLGRSHAMEGQHPEFADAVRGLYSNDSLIYDPGRGRRALKTEEKAAGGIPLVYSNELILDSPKDKGLVIRRIAETFAPCRVILTVREQCSWLKSLYGHTNYKLKDLPSPCNGKFLPLEDWLAFHAKRYELQRGHFWNLRYDLLADGLARELGRENVGILLFEELTADPERFCGRLCGFLGVPPDPTLARVVANARFNPHRADRWFQKQMFMERLRHRGGLLGGNKTIRRAIGALYSNFHKTEGKVEVTLPDRWQHHLRDTFAEPNRTLARDWDLPLADYGYLT